jgi:acetyltransferase
MDKHYLAPLFSPATVVVFAGARGESGGSAPPALVGTLQEALRAQRFAGTLHFLDIETSGTLGDLAQTRADLAIIALPPREIAAALEVAGRLRCRAA